MKITVRLTSYLSKGLHKPRFIIVEWQADKAHITPFDIEGEGMVFPTKEKAQNIAKNYALKKVEELYPGINIETDVKLEFEK